MDTRLYNAASQGQVHVVRQHIDQLEIQTTANSNTALHVAAQFGQLPCVTAILEVCPSLLRRVNIRDETPLHMAAREGYPDIVKKLIECAKRREQLLESGLGGEAKKMLRATNVDKDTALHMAVRNCNVKEGKYLEVIKLLTEEDREFEHPANNDDETPLYLAVERRREDVVTSLLSDCTSPTYSGPGGKTALHAATFNRWQPENNKIVVIVGERVEQLLGVWDCRWLLARCCAGKIGEVVILPIGSATATYGMHRISDFVKQLTEVASKSELMVDALLAWRPDLIRETDIYGWTPLHSAARSGNDSVVKKLLENDKSVAYVAADGDKGNTALHIAAAVGDVTVMEELLSYCPDCWEIVNNEGQNVLHISAYYEMNLTTDFILEKPWVTHLINQKDNEGNTPLHLIASKRKGKPLGEYPRADALAVNYENWTPYDLRFGEVNSKDWPRLLVNWRDTIRKDRERIIKWKMSKEQTEREKREKEVQEEREREEKREREKEREDKRFEGMAETHMIVATLVATISFAASFTIPGGYHQEGRDEGMAVLVRDSAFKAFVITNTVAVICSTSSVFLYLSASLFKVDDEEEEKVAHRYLMALSLVIIALVAMTIAFITGTYAVLGHSLGLAIPTCVIACSSFVVYASEITKHIRKEFK